MRSSFCLVKMIVLSAALAVPATGMAALTTYTQTQTQSFNFVPDGTATLNFNQYTGSLSSLTKVTVTVSLTKSGGTYAIDNDSASSGSVTLTQKLTGALYSSDVSLATVGHDVGAYGRLAATSTTTISIGATSGDATNQFNVTNKSDYYSWSPGDVTKADSGDVLASGWTTGDLGYVGSGSFNLYLDANQSQATSGLSGLAASYTAALASGFVTVSYEYVSAVPEPASALMLLLGSVGLLARRSRRR